jgi:hypothetical protein
MVVISDWQPGLSHQEEQDFSLLSHPQEPFCLPSHLSNWLYCQDSYLYPSLTVSVHGTLTPLFLCALVWCLDTGTNVLF